MRSSISIAVGRTYVNKRVLMRSDATGCKLMTRLKLSPPIRGLFRRAAAVGLVLRSPITNVNSGSLFLSTFTFLFVDHANDLSLNVLTALDNQRYHSTNGSSHLDLDTQENPRESLICSPRIRRIPHLYVASAKLARPS